ncbi:MAG: sigma-54-dependent Fis family transcriptional regulator [Planctomycetes bacterium]|nr:sigma-54-dependent Fis family transcriptional regulator [Planctomycetota bacterium]
MPRILIVDDQAAVRDELVYALNFEGYETVAAADGDSALREIEQGGVDVMLLDIKMPGMDGLQVLGKAKERRPDLPVVMISGHGDIETAVLAVKGGAYDFLTKPFDTDRVLVSIKNALHLVELDHENRALRRELAREVQILGRSQAIQQVRALIQKVAPTEAAVLISGGNGTGKELVARQIHALSKRARGPFVAINCAAIPAELLESELFGHEKGAFTGASAMRRGHFEAANGGTIFLDEVGDLALEAQAKLLRALQEKVIVRVGGSKEFAVDARVLAATNQDLPAMVQAKTFREDLFYRLNVVPITMPSLRERAEDIEDLAQHFLTEACRRNGLPARRLLPAALERLRAQPWPGNVRQLKNQMERVAILAEGKEVRAEDLGDMLDAPAAAESGGDLFAHATIEEFRAAAEREYIRRKLQEHGGNIKRTAERIGIQRSNLYKKLERYGLK